MRRLHYAVAVLVAFVSLIVVFSQSKQIITPPDAATAPGLPFSAGVRAGDLLYLSGAMGTREGKLVGHSIEAQTRQALENLGSVLRAAGMDHKDVVAATVYLRDARYFDRMNQVYREFFKTRPPVRATVEADLVLPNGLVEISFIAADPQLPRDHIEAPGWFKNPLPYSRAIRVGDYLFLAGLVSQNPRTGKPIEGDIKAQTRNTLENIRGLVRTAGFHMNDMVVSRVWLDDPRDFRGMNDVYRSYFPDAPPTRATTKGRIMAPEYKIEIMLTGLKGERQVIGTPGASPFSPAIKVGNRLFVSGIVRATDQTRGDIRGQTRAVLAEITSLLRQGGMELSDVVDSNVWLADARYYDEMNDVYREFFLSDPPARATVAADLMSPSGLIEIAVTAVK